MKNIQLGQNNEILIEIDQNEYDKSTNKEFIKKESISNSANGTYYYKTITDEQEKNTIINYKIYETLIKIKNIGLFFVILTIINIIASVILALR